MYIWSLIDVFVILTDILDIIQAKYKDRMKDIYYKNLKKSFYPRENRCARDY